MTEKRGRGDYLFGELPSPAPTVWPRIWPRISDLIAFLGHRCPRTFAAGPSRRRRRRSLDQRRHPAICHYFRQAHFVASRSGKGFIQNYDTHRTQILYSQTSPSSPLTSTSPAALASSRQVRPYPSHRILLINPSQPTGTGSGSFSHSVARTVSSSGHLWSYEFHELRASNARTASISI